jgi:hypothetical protein
MRTLGTIPHPQMLITLFLWNNKYILKFEAGPYEQCYKVDETLAPDPEEIKALVDDSFIESVTRRFLKMNEDFTPLLGKLQG